LVATADDSAMKQVSATAGRQQSAVPAQLYGITILTNRLLFLPVLKGLRITVA
jgi:hypothetical protein